MITAEYIKKHTETKLEVADLKIWLGEKQIQEYASWKERNPSDKSAMEKILGQIKVNDNEWVEKEDECKKLEILLSTQSLILGILQSTLTLVFNGTLSKKDFTDYENKFNSFFE